MVFQKGNKICVGRICSEETRKKKSLSIKGRKYPYRCKEGNTNWKGNDAGYFGLHEYINRNFIKPNQCDMCGAENKRLQLAFKYHPKPYTRNREDYLYLDCSCHRKMDYNLKSINRLREIIYKGLI